MFFITNIQEEKQKNQSIVDAPHPFLAKRNSVKPARFFLNPFTASFK